MYTSAFQWNTNAETTTAEKEKIEPGRTGPDRTGPDRTGPNVCVPLKSRCIHVSVAQASLALPVKQNGVDERLEPDEYESVGPNNGRANDSLMAFLTYI